MANSTSSLVVKLTTAGMTAASTLFLARYLGPSQYGVFALAVGISALLVRPADFGISASASRFAAEHHDDLPVVARVLGDAARLKLPASVAIAVLLALLAGPIANLYGQPGLAWPLRGVALAVLGQSFFMLYLSAFSAVRRVPLQMRVVVLESAVELGSTVLLVLLGAGATGAAFGRGAGYLFGAVAAFGVAARLLGREVLPTRRGHGSGSRIARYAGTVFLVDSAFTLFEEIDVLLIGAFLAASDVAFFQAPLRIVAFLHYPGLALASGVAPRMARTADTEPDVKGLARALRLLVVLQVPMAVGAAVWARPVTDLVLGTGYAAAADVLRALAVFIFLAGVAPLVTISVHYSGQARRRGLIAVVTVAVNAAIDVVLIPRIGVVGGAVGTTVAYLIYVPAHLRLCRQIFGLELWPLGQALGRCVLAALPMAATMALIGLQDVSAIAFVLGGAASLVVYAAGLVAVREIRTEELVGLLRRAKARHDARG